MRSEPQLLEALRSRERAQREQGEAELFATFLPRVRAILSRIVGSGADLDDAVQETFIDIFRGLPKFDGRAALGTWIYRITLRRGWKVSARQQAHRKKHSDAASSDPPPSATQDPTEVETRELACRIEVALTKLDYDHRSILAMSAFQGLGSTEIADTLGIPVGTVHSRLSRAREKLRAHLGMK